MASWSYTRFHGSKNPGVATKFPDVVLKPLAQQLVENWQKGARTHYAYFLNDLDAEAPRSAKRYVQLVADVGGMSVKEVFGGFSPVWTRRKADIASFFKPAEKGVKRKEPEKCVNRGGDEGLDDGKSAWGGRDDEKESLVAAGLGKDNDKRRKLSATNTSTLSPKAGIEKIKVSPSRIRKNASTKRGVKSITDYFSVSSGKSSGD